MGRRNLATVEKKLGFQKSRVKTMLVIFFDWKGVIHKEFVPEGETLNALYYKVVTERLPNRIRRVRPGMCKSGDWFLLHDNAPYHNATIVKQFLPQRKVTVLDYPPFSPDLAPALNILYPKVKSHLKRHLFDSISDVQKALTNTLTFRPRIKSRLTFAGIVRRLPYSTRFQDKC